jgi:general secretion pathway protein A
LLQRIAGRGAPVAFIFNSAMPFDGLLEYMLGDFGISTPGHTQAQRLFALNRFLIERRREGQTAIAIVDEAQNLSATSLEHLRLLSNFETPDAKLLQILLVGQPELGDKLAQPELRQLRQRIGLRCAIHPLTHDETREYIASRLRIAGAADPHLFADAAVARIAAHTGGIPRRINILADHCLLVGYSEQTRRIDRRVVERAIEAVDGGFESGARRTARRRAWTPSRWLVGSLGAAALAGLATLGASAGGLGVPSHLVDQLLLFAREARDLVTR